jgi:hypothetical protein
MKSARFAEILRLFAKNDVEVIVVGLLAGVLQGAPVTTGDVDVVHRRSPENVARLLRVLRQIDAVYRHDPRRLAPNESHLLGPGHQLLESKLGDVDCLGAIDAGKTYEDLIGATTLMELGHGLALPVIELDTLIEIKRRAGRPKDIAVLPILEATRDERNRLR